MADGAQYAKQLDEEYTHMREQYHNEQQQLLSLDEARRNRLKLFE
jgi:5-methyltetrahydrofolate--homocysteine methyltransferase